MALEAGVADPNEIRMTAPRSWPPGERGPESGRFPSPGRDGVQHFEKQRRTRGYLYIRQKRARNRSEIATSHRRLERRRTRIRHLQGLDVFFVFRVLSAFVCLVS